MRTVVVQLEDDEVLLLVGYRPGSGESTESVMARAASNQKLSKTDALREVLAGDAMAPLDVIVDGDKLVRTSVRSKFGFEDGGGRPMVVVLATYKRAKGSKLEIVSRDAKSTRISWQDREVRCSVGQGSPAQDRWFDGVASFLLDAPACESSGASSSSPDLPSAH